jgi:hypothetical protein
MAKVIFKHSSVRFITLVLASLFFTLSLFVLISVASADGVYQSEHIEFYPVGSQPLRSGFVENIHTNGPQVYALEQYVLNGAAPNTQYYIKPFIFLENSGCTNGLIPFPVENSINTNTTGNGTTLVKITPDVAAGLGGLTINVRWQLLVGSPDGPAAYETNCAVVTLD